MIEKPIKEKKLSLSNFTNDLPLSEDAPSDGNYYSRKDGAWVEVPPMRGVAVFVQTTEPTSPQDGDLWIKI